MDGAIERSFAMIAAAVARSRESPDATSMVVFGGELTLAPEHYIGEFLDIVNYNAFGNDPLQPLLSGKSAGVRFGARKTQHLVTLLDRLSNGLRSQHIERYRRLCKHRIHGKVLSIPSVASTDGKERLIFASGDASQAYVILWLLDPNLPYGSRVRHCALDHCDNFLLTISGKAGPPRKFCSEAHARDYDRVKAKKRAEDWRAKHRPNTGRKHK